jgi:hypothetical protein
MDRYPSIDRIGQLSAPLLVIAGERDTLVRSSPWLRGRDSGMAFVSWCSAPMYVLLCKHVYANLIRRVAHLFRHIHAASVI